MSAVSSALGFGSPSSLPVLARSNPKTHLSLFRRGEFLIAWCHILLAPPKVLAIPSVELKAVGNALQWLSSISAFKPAELCALHNVRIPNSIGRLAQLPSTSAVRHGEHHASSPAGPSIPFLSLESPSSSPSASPRAPSTPGTMDDHDSGVVARASSDADVKLDDDIDLARFAVNRKSDNDPDIILDIRCRSASSVLISRTILLMLSMHTAALLSFSRVMTPAFPGG